ISNLADTLATRLWPDTLAEAVTRKGDDFLVDVRIADGHRSILAKALLFCGGRFGPIWLKQQDIPVRYIHRRYEIGVRIQQPSQSFFLQRYEEADPKLSWSADGIHEYRTFCCCRNGEVVVSETAGIFSVS